jgi:hypothetical protein
MLSYGTFRREPPVYNRSATLVEHRAKIVRAKKPLVASSFPTRNPQGPVQGYS